MGVNEMFNSAKDFVSENGGELLDKAKDFAEDNSELVDKAKDSATDVVENVKDKFGL